MVLDRLETELKELDTKLKDRAALHRFAHRVEGEEALACPRCEAAITIQDASCPECGLVDPAHSDYEPFPTVDQATPIAQEYLRLRRSLIGRWACPKSLLPGDVRDVGRALIAYGKAMYERDKTKQARAQQKDFLNAALVELSTFVADTDAELVERYRRSQADTLADSLPAEERAQAVRVLAEIKDMAAQIIGELWGDQRGYSAASAGLKQMKSPVEVGEGIAALKAVRRHRWFQRIVFFVIPALFIVYKMAEFVLSLL